MAAAPIYAFEGSTPPSLRFGREAHAPPSHVDSPDVLSESLLEGDFLRRRRLGKGLAGQERSRGLVHPVLVEHLSHLLATTAFHPEAAFVPPRWNSREPVVASMSCWPRGLAGVPLETLNAFGGTVGTRDESRSRAHHSRSTTQMSPSLSPSDRYREFVPTVNAADPLPAASGPHAKSDG